MNFSEMLRKDEFGHAPQRELDCEIQQPYQFRSITALHPLFN
nr:3606_t:CDS:2 [Entrophospora candida]